MSSLSMPDKRFIYEYIKKHGKKRVSGLNLSVAGAMLSTIGLVVFVAAVNTLQRSILSDHLAPWILLPCLFAGVLLIGIGIGFLMLERKHAEEHRLCTILRKIVQPEDPSG
jgi:hypothetical protein